MRKTCGTCRWLEKSDGEPYCLLRDLYTHRREEDMACEDYMEENHGDNQRQDNGH